MAEDRRQSRRFSLRQIIDVSSQLETFFQAEGLNLSEGGVLCKTAYPVEPLMRVYLMLSLPGEGGTHLLKTDGKVVHVQKTDGACLFGVAFENMEPRDQEALRAYLAALEGQTV